MNVMKKIGSAIETKYVAAGVALTMPFMAFAEDPGTMAAGKISALETGVAAVGGAILGVALAVVGFFVIKRMLGRV